MVSSLSRRAVVTAVAVGLAGCGTGTDEPSTPSATETPVDLPTESPSPTPAESSEATPTVPSHEDALETPDYEKTLLVENADEDDWAIAIRVETDVPDAENPVFDERVDVDTGAVLETFAFDAYERDEVYEFTIAGELLDDGAVVDTDEFSIPASECYGLPALSVRPGGEIRGSFVVC